MNDDSVLLRRYAKEGSEAAFQELVKRNLPLVYSTALRQIGGDAYLAQDIAQTVFADLARAAGSLAPNVVVPGWLYRATQFAAAKAVRGERRRRTREEAVVLEQMQTLNDVSHSKWDALSEELDEAIKTLGETDRNAILLRFFQHLDFQAVGAALNVSADTAQKRVSRALDKLRGSLTQRGVALSAAALATLLAEQAGAVPPAGLIASIGAHVGAVVPVAAPAAARGILHSAPRWLGAKPGYSIALLTLGTGLAGILMAPFVAPSRQPQAHAKVAKTYDVSRDFSRAANPNGVWSYGWAPALSGPVQWLSFNTEKALTSGILHEFWSYASGLDPAIFHNHSTQTAIVARGQGIYPPGAVWVTPGLTGRGENYGVIRFTAPPDGTGLYHVATAVETLYHGPISGDTDFHIVTNGVEWFGIDIDPSSGSAFTNTLHLAAGDTIDLMVGRGKDGRQRESGLKIQATITTGSTKP